MKLKNKVTVIAEAGVNHNGLLKNALKMVDVASKAGADYIKFQTFDPKSLANSNLGLAKYQKKNSGQNSHLKMLSKLSLSEKEFRKILNRCKKKKIKFLSSPFDIFSINILKKLKVNIFKIPSGQIDDVPYLQYLGALKKKIFLSTGMSTLLEIKKAIRIILSKGTPKKNIEILHCVSQYPAEKKNLNLNSIKFLQNNIKLPVGFSDHSLGYNASLIAIGLGSRVIEKHFTLNKKMAGWDHAISADPKEMKKLVLSTKLCKKILGKFNRSLSNEEKKSSKIMRRGIYANKEIKKGDKFNDENIILQRPETKLNANFYSKIIGKKSKNKIIANVEIKAKDFKN